MNEIKTPAAPDISVIETLKSYSDTMTISQAVSLLNRFGCVVTKTMIQNYVRVSALPPPDGRRYTKNHLLMILLIGHLKAVYSLDEIRALLADSINKAFDNPSGFYMAEVYVEFCENYKNKKSNLNKTKRPLLDAAADCLACKDYSAVRTVENE